MTSFAVKMVWRETRAAWRHFFYFFVCIALGVSALVSVGLFAANVERAVTREARGLLGGDLEVRTSRPMSEAGEQVLRSLASRGILMTHVSELVAMAAAVNDGQARSGPTTQLVELKAVEPGYPLYGTVKADPDRPLSSLLTSIRTGCAAPFCYGALVQESLLIRMGLSVGDHLKIGQATFLIAGVIRKEPDRIANAFSLGPRVMISREGLAAAELVKPGSRVRERYLLKVSPEMPIPPLLDELRGRLAGEMVRVSSYREAQPQLKQFLEQLARYLGLVGLTALFVGGIGVATSVQAFLREKLQTIAILKTLGADSATVVKTYLGQAAFLGVLGSVTGAGLGVALQDLLPDFIAGLFATNVLEQIAFSSELSRSSWLPLFNGMSLGLLTTVLFSVWPLLGIREIRPALILRHEVAGSEGAPLAGAAHQWKHWRWRVGADDPVRAITAISIAAGLAGLSMWQAGSWKVGLVFLGALVLAIALLSLAAAALVRAIRWVPTPRSLAVRYAIGNLYRPGSHATGIVVSVGIGVMVIMAVGLLERSLIRQLGENRPEDAPTFFFIDIQPDQADGFVRLLHERTGDLNPQLTPLVRSRLAAINGRPVKIEEGGEEERDKPRDKRKSWYFTREYVLTFLDRLPKDNEVVKGKWWKPGQVSSKPLVSVEEEAARNLGLDVGSVVEFEIQGATVSAEVSSIRKVDWGNFSTNFYMILSPGSLEGVPVTYVATARVPPQDEIPLQQAVVAAFPNVTAINIGDVLDSFARLLDRLSLAIRAVAAFCILAGALVMAAALAATRYRRLYESVILKALGATRGLIARSFATEYALLGAIAGVIGIALASALSWAVLYFILDLPWSFQPGVLAVGFLLTVALNVTVGFLATFRILGRRPLAVLRQE